MEVVRMAIEDEIENFANLMSHDIKPPKTCPVFILRKELAEESFNGQAYAYELEESEIMSYALEYPTVSLALKAVFPFERDWVNVDFQYIDADIPTFINIVPEGYLMKQRTVWKHRSQEVWDSVGAVVKPSNGLYWSSMLYAAIPAFFMGWKKIRITEVSSKVTSRIVPIEDLIYSKKTKVSHYSGGEYKESTYKVPTLSWYDAALLEIFLTRYAIERQAFRSIYLSPLYPFRYLQCRICPYYPAYCGGIVPSIRRCADEIDADHYRDFFDRFPDRYSKEPQQITYGECGMDIPTKLRGELMYLTTKPLELTESMPYTYIDKNGDEKNAKARIRALPTLLSNTITPVYDLCFSYLRKDNTQRKQELINEYGMMLSIAIRSLVSIKYDEVV